MNASEGLSRIAQVIRIIGYLILAGSILGAYKSNFEIIYIGLFFCFICLAVAWIIDGFAKK